MAERKAAAARKPSAAKPAASAAKDDDKDAPSTPRPISEDGRRFLRQAAVANGLTSDMGNKIADWLDANEHAKVTISGKSEAGESNFVSMVPDPISTLPAQDDDDDEDEDGGADEP